MYGFLNYIHIPFGLSLAIYLVFNVFEPKLVWWIIGIHVILGIVYLTALIGWPDIQFDPLPTEPRELVDVNIKHIVGTINTAFLISAVLALGFNFLEFEGN